MRALLALSCLPLVAQVHITASRTGDDIARYLVGAVSQNIAPYMAMVCADGQGAVVVSPDRVIQALEDAGLAVQPGDDVLNTVRAYRGGKARVVAYNFAIGAMKLIPAAAFAVGPVEDRRDQLRNFEDPKGWWRPGIDSVPLVAGGKCLTLKFGVLVAPDLKSVVHATLQPTTHPASLMLDIPDATAQATAPTSRGGLATNLGAVSPATKFSVEEADKNEVLDGRAEMVAAMIRARLH